MSPKHNATGRSPRKLSQFGAFEHYIFECAAWRSLSLAARSAILEIMYGYKGTNNGRIIMSARMLAERLPLSRQHATRALRELTDCGFIEVMRTSGFNMKSGTRRATEWRLTMFRCDVSGEKPSKAFMHWHAGKMHFTKS